ncbi:MAG: 2-C-methyl-D-erythritol 4-phosphate cytidylyltransferase [candidate division WOR-3 bacterium]
MNFGIILAAGQGKRFGQKKQFYLIKNKPVIYYSLKKFNDSPDISKIIVVTNKTKIRYVQNLVKKYKFNKVIKVIAGGKERQDSVKNALRILPDNGYVAIHDSARPLLNSAIIAQGFNYVKRYQACIPVIDIADTVKELDGNFIKSTQNRANFYLAQTPQFFEIRLLKQAYADAEKDNFYATDDASLVERLGKKVYAFRGIKSNIKITDKEDIRIIKNLL